MFGEAALDAFLDLSELCAKTSWLYEQRSACRRDKTTGKEERLEALEAEYLKVRRKMAEQYTEAIRLNAPPQLCNDVVLNLLPTEALAELRM